LPTEVCDSLILNGRYHIGRLIDEGSYGKVYKITDAENQQLPLVIKLQKTMENAGIEVNSIRKIDKRNMIAYGCVLIGDTIHGYFIMPRFG
jgi:hypothetical protein